MAAKGGRSGTDQIEMELQVFGAFLRGDDELRGLIYREVPVESIVNLKDAYQAIYKRYLNGDTISMDAIRLCDNLDVVQRGMVESLGNVAPITDRRTIEQIISIMRQDFRTFKLRKSLKPALLAAYKDGVSPEFAVGHLMETLQTLSEEFSRGREITTIGGKNGEVSELLDLVFSGNQVTVPIGYKGFDEPCGGAGLGDLIIINATTGSGKTTFMLDSAKRIVDRGHSVAFFSLEIPKSQVLKRLVSNIANVPFASLWNQAAHDKQLRNSVAKGLTSWRDRLKTKDALLDVIDDPEVRIADIFAIVRAGGHKVVFIDYLNLLTEGDGDRHERLGMLARNLKILARRLDVAVVVAVQKDEETGKIRYAREIKEHADVVLGWNGLTEEKLSQTQSIQVYVEKGRNIPRFAFTLLTDFSHMRMQDLTTTSVIGNAATTDDESDENPEPSSEAETAEELAESVGECSTGEGMPSANEPGSEDAPKPEDESATATPETPLFVKSDGDDEADLWEN